VTVRRRSVLSHRGIDGQRAHRVAKVPWHRGAVDDIFASPTDPVGSWTEVFLGYLDYFKGRIVAKTEALGDESAAPAGSRRAGRHGSYQAPQLCELCWLEWGFEGCPVEDPSGDERGDRWWVSPEETTEDLIAALRAQAARSRAIIEANDLESVGRPGPRWDGAGQPPSSGCCSTSSKSTHATSVTSMS